MVLSIDSYVDLFSFSVCSLQTGYTSGAERGIMKDMGLSIAEVSFIL